MWRTGMSVVLLMVLCCSTPAFAFQRQFDKVELTDVQLRERVLRSIRNAKRFLRSRQSNDGSWTAESAIMSEYRVGITAICVLALLNADEPLDSPPVASGLRFLRSLPSYRPGKVYEASLVVMALCAADQPRIDRAQLLSLVDRLEKTQCTQGPLSGLWGYDVAGIKGSRRPGQNGEDRSNGQFAVLALRDAAYAGIRVDRKVWKRTHDHWLESQLGDGGWKYNNDPRGKARGSMTAAGLSTLAITSRMLQDDSDVDQEGQPDCCSPHPPEQAFERGREWIKQRFSVEANPGYALQHFYYLYGLERASRLGNVRFYGDFDWYRQGARYFAATQRGDGSWAEASQAASPPTLSTAYALLFLSKGLSRVVVNKLDYMSPKDRELTSEDWNRHPLDVTNLIDKIDGLEKWPPRLTSQVLKLSRLNDETATRTMNQAPVLYISGVDAPKLTDQHIRWLRSYIDEGGFLFAVATCEGGTFDEGMREIVNKLFPNGEGTLQRLRADHPVYRSEYALTDASEIELYGVDFGCRTAIIYSPEDLGCLWQKWMRHDPPDRKEGLIQRIIRANRIGINVIAYATGREPPIKLNAGNDRKKRSASAVSRGLTEVAQLRHSGGWDTAPKAIGNLLEALNTEVGATMSPVRRSVPIALEELKRFPIAYMHGRYGFKLSDQEMEALKTYLDRGGLLFADACCGSEQFDRSFRDVLRKLYPEQQLDIIPADSELFSDAIGHQLQEVTIRQMVQTRNAAMQMRQQKLPPLLEGIEVNGRYAVIYSKYDLSCALENQASLACDGYIEEDAMKIAMNIVLYAMLQDVQGGR